MKHFRFILLLLLPVLGFAQNKADEIIASIKPTSSDSFKVAAYNNAAWEFINSEPQKGEGFALKALAIAEKTNNKISLSDTYNTLGSLKMMGGEGKVAIAYHLKALEIRKQLKDVKGIAKTYSNLGVAYDELTDYNAEIDLFFKALPFAEASKDSAFMSVIYNNLAGAYRNILKPSLAIEYNKKALAIREKQHDENGIISSVINLGNNYADLKKYSDAEKYFNIALEKLRTTSDNNMLTGCLNNLASIYIKTRRITEALQLLEQAMTANNERNNLPDICLSYIRYEEAYLAINQYDKSIESGNKALELTKIFGSKDFESQIYYNLAMTYEKKNDFSKAYTFLGKYSMLKDSIYDTDFNKKYALLQTQYETEKKDSRIQLLEEQQQVENLKMKQRNLFILIISITLLLSIVSGLIYIRFQRFKSKQKQLAVVNATEENERRRIAKDIHDELGSGLTKIRFLSEISSSQTSDNPDLNKNIVTVSETANNLVENMRDLIWALNPDNTTLDNLMSRIREYSSDYVEEAPIDLSFDFQENVPDVKISKEAHRNIFMTIKEALQNMVKHSGASRGLISLNIRSQKLEISITDNGKGFDTNSPQSANSNGLINMRHRIENLGGQYAILSENTGTDISFSFLLGDVVVGEITKSIKFK
jgi:signal transduction histidine kinase